VKVAFHQEQLCERGTTAALFDYARHNETLLGNESLVLYRRGDPRTLPAQERLFAGGLRCRTYERFAEVERILEEEHVDAFYAIKYGRVDEVVVGTCPNLIHSVVACEPHGEVYAFISRWMSTTFGGGISFIPFVPLMIDLPAVRTDLRERLGIPRDAVVLGRHGGRETFDIPFVHRAVARMVDEDPRLWFLFLNTDPFMPRHSRVLHLPTVDRSEIAAFIHTCDAMIHARRQGENFGLAVGEFSAANRPVITFSASPEAAHLEILREKGIYYADEADLLRILRSIRELVKSRDDWNAYREYRPEAVMRKFAAIFLAACG
jgi:hypothetical protein